MIARRTLLLSAAALPLAAAAPAQTLSDQDKADIGRVETYLDSLRSLKARFIQVAHDGSVSEGTAWLERPGRMRFQYNPPSPFTLIANNGDLIFNDSSLQQTSNVSLSRTPLGILLADKVDLNGAVAVTSVQRLPGQLQVTMTRAGSPGDGSLTLIFADPPLTLRQWTVVDSQRRETHVTLYNAKLGGTFDPRLFDHITVTDPKDG